MSDQSYTTEEVARLLRVSKLTVYDLIKKGELPAYRVGRQMRVEAADLEAYKVKMKGGSGPVVASAAGQSHAAQSYQESEPRQGSLARQVIISGQDISLDILASHMEKGTKIFRPLRSYVGSLDSLIALYKGESDIVSTHLFDGDTGEYNVPYIRKLLVNHRFVVVNMIYRRIGYYVQKGNPKQIQTWTDLNRKGVRMINREKGSGARVLIDEQLRLHDLSGADIDGYGREEMNHLGVAGTVARGEADVGVGIEKAANIVGVDFIPLMKERYDLVMLKTLQNRDLIEQIVGILRSPAFQGEIQSIGGYDLSDTGKILFEN